MTLRRGPVRPRRSLSDSEKAPTREEVAALLEVAAREEASEVRRGPLYGNRARDRLLLRTLLLTGLRASELAALRASDFTKASAKAWVLRVRGGKKRPATHTAEIPIPATLAVDLATWTAGLERSEPLFAIRDRRTMTRRHVWRILERLSRKAKLRRRITPHACRHFYVTELARQVGGNPLVVAKLARVRRVETLLTYFHLDRAKGEIAKLRLPPARALQAPETM